MRNLLENAITRTSKGDFIEIRAAQEGNWIAVSIEDNGEGIPAEDLPYIFERFYRVDAGRSRQMGGTGLGLSIVRHVTLLHGGTVDVDSALGLGSTFTIRIPVSTA